MWIFDSDIWLFDLSGALWVGLGRAAILVSGSLGGRRENRTGSPQPPMTVADNHDDRVLTNVG